jgi:hypothetical protein
MGATSGAGTAYHFGAPVFKPGFRQEETLYEKWDKNNQRYVGWWLYILIDQFSTEGCDNNINTCNNV